MIKTYDPVAQEEAKHIFQDKIIHANSLEECLKDSDICIIVTEWPEFKKITSDLLNKLMKSKNIVDGRRIIDPKKFSNDFQVRIIGRGIITE